MGVPTSETSQARSQGFTLVESVILISIVGILAVTAAPRFLSVSDMHVNSAHRQALSDFRFAQQLATATGCPVQIDFTVAGYRLTQRVACRSGAFTQPVVDPSTNAPPFDVTVPSGVVLTSSVDPILFNSLGEATNASGNTGDVTISVGSRSLEVVGQTGLVRVP